MAYDDYTTIKISVKDSVCRATIHNPPINLIDLPLIRSWMEASGYRGMHEVEIFSTRWWQEDADSVLVACRSRHQSHS